MENLKINFKNLDVILDNDTIILNRNNIINEVTDTRLAYSIRKYNRLEKRIDSDLNEITNRNKDNNRTKFILLLVNLLSIGAISISVFSKLYTILLFSVLPLTISSASIKQLIIDNSFNKNDINLLKKLKEDLLVTEKMLENNIIDRFDNIDDYNHYLIYTENKLDDIDSKMLIK